MASPPGVAASAEQVTGTRDETYDLVSVLYHALQGAQTAMQYVQDAEREGDPELVRFFRDAQVNGPIGAVTPMSDEYCSRCYKFAGARTPLLRCFEDTPTASSPMR